MLQETVETHGISIFKYNSDSLMGNKFNGNRYLMVKGTQKEACIF